MLLWSAVALSVCSAFLELLIVTKIPWLHRLCKKAPLIGLLFSFLLSVLVGEVFGAAGLVVMLAGVGSTVITSPIYWVSGQIDKYKENKKQRVKGERKAYFNMGYWKCAHCGSANKHSNSCKCSNCGTNMADAFTIKEEESWVFN